LTHADLLALDERDGALVLVENQLEVADDDHLGKILAYLALSGARAAVWIATRFTEPHLAAVRWLNATAGPGSSFYAVRVDAVRIGNSEPAAFFEVCEGPGGGARIPTTTSRVGVGGFAAAFWAAHEQRYSDESRQLRALGERCRWRATALKGIVIGLIVEENAVKAYLRGRYGVPLEAVARTLAPFANELERGLHAPLRGANAAVLAENILAVNVMDRTNWGATSDWLQLQSEAYAAALRALAPETPDRRWRRRPGKILAL
jgi:hypothetical protein